MLNYAQKSVDIDVSKGFWIFICYINKFDGLDDFMVSYAVLNLVGKAMVEFRKRLLKTFCKIKELMKAITSLKEVKTAKFLRKQALENDGLEIWDGNHIENIKLDFDGMYSQEENNWIDATVEGGNPEDETVTAG